MVRLIEWNVNSNKIYWRHSFIVQCAMAKFAVAVHNSKAFVVLYEVTQKPGQADYILKSG